MSMEQIQQLRAQTGAGVVAVKKALDEAKGDESTALDLLRKRGQKVAMKKAGRDVSEGLVSSYIHMDRIGVLLELNCETDFVARTDDFKALSKDIAMQIASMNPLYVKAEDIPHEVLEKEEEIYAGQVEAGTDAEIIKKIIAGKLAKYKKEVSLLDQKFFKDEDKTIADVVTDAIGRMGENIQIRRFTRFSLDDLTDKPKVC